MKKLILGIASALLLSGAAQANDLKMATLPANLSQAITMATFANIVSAELSDVGVPLQLLFLGEIIQVEN